MALVLMATAAEVPPSVGTTSCKLAAKASDRAERLDPARLTATVMILVIEIAIYGASSAILGCTWRPIPPAVG